MSILLNAVSRVKLLADEKTPIWIRYAALWKIKSGRAPFLKALGIAPFQFRYEDLVTWRDSIINELCAACALAGSEPGPRIGYHDGRGGIG